MHYLLRTFLPLWGILCITSAAAASIQPTAPDTLPGHAQAVRKLSATMCQKLEEENARKPLTQLSAAESKELITQLTISSMGANAEAIAPVLAPNRAKSSGELLGRDMVLDLARTCPLGQTLIVRMSTADTKLRDTATDRERPLLSTLSTEICQQLDQNNATTPLAEQSAGGRMEFMQQAMTTVILRHLDELQTVYGKKVFSNKGQMSDIGRKVALLMADQCPSYIMQLGADQIEKKNK